MRVMITGGTGFIGYHAALRLLDSGHEVCLLVRSLDKAHGLFGERNNLQCVKGDINDRDSLRRALRNCDAMIHSAAVVSTSGSDAQSVYRINTEGTKAVMEVSLEKELQSIIHVSSVTALYDRKAKKLDENSPPGPEGGRSGYGKSKIAIEKYVRSLQDEGAPISIIYPGAVIGPDDPGLTEPHKGILSLMLGVAPSMPTGNQYIDVRDVAEAIYKILETRPESNRFPLGGHFLPWSEHAALLRELTGRLYISVPINSKVTLFTGKVIDRLKSHINIDLPVSEEGMTYATGWVKLDDSHTLETLKIKYRPLRKSLSDALISLSQKGHISAKKLGKLADY